MESESYPNADRLVHNSRSMRQQWPQEQTLEDKPQKFANETGLSIHVSHFPQGTSKLNKIEQRLFAFISKKLARQVAVCPRDYCDPSDNYNF